MPNSIARRIFHLDPAIRYVAWAEPGRIIEMAQHPDHPSFGPAETDRMEELLLNPAVYCGWPSCGVTWTWAERAGW